MNASQIMSKTVKACRPDDTLQTVARIMWDEDCGIVPVVDQDSCVVGVITDRDICMAAFFGDAPLGDLGVEKTMCVNVYTCRPNDPIEVAENLMRLHQVHRVPVTDGGGHLVGVLSLNDIVVEAEHERHAKGKRKVSDHEIAATLAAISAHRPRTEDVARTLAPGGNDNPPRKPLPRRTLEALRRQLLAQQRALFEEVEDVEADLRFLEEDRESEIEERAQEETMARLLARLEDRQKHELEEVYRALAKIPSGAYGACERCGKPISLERLEAAPAVRFCLDCERDHETMRVEPARRFEPGSHRPVPPEYRGLNDEEMAETVRERIREHGAPDFECIEIRCHGGVVKLSGEIPSEPQRQVLLQIITDGMGLEVIDRLRLSALERKEVGEPTESEPETRPEERIVAGEGMKPLPPERLGPPEDEGEPPPTPPEAPVPEKE